MSQEVGHVQVQAASEDDNVILRNAVPEKINRVGP